MAITRPDYADVYEIRNGTTSGEGPWDQHTIAAALIDGLQSGGGGGGGGGSSATYVGSTPGQLTVGTTSSVAIAASASFRRFSIYNNSGAVLTFAIGATPVSDSGTIEAPNYNGYGTQIFPGGYYESPEAIKEVVNIIASAASSKATVTLFTQS